VQPGEIFEGEVKRILPFGAFVEICGKEGMVHVSKMSTEFVNDPKWYRQNRTKWSKLRVAEIDDQGELNLSMLFGEDAG